MLDIKIKKSSLFSSKRKKKSALKNSHHNHCDETTECSSSCSSSSSELPQQQQQQQQRRRSVTFSADGCGRDVSTSICPILSLSDMSQKEIADSWYNDCEFKIIKLDIVNVLRKMIASGKDGSSRDHYDETTRGLEKKTPCGSKARKQHRYSALWAVLDEQDRQRVAHGQALDSESIAELYRQSSAESQQEAVAMAARDAQQVMEDDEQEEQEEQRHESVPPATKSSLVVPPFPETPVSERSRKPAATAADFKPPVPLSPATPKRSGMRNVLLSPHRQTSRRRMLSMMLY